jgi:hypothetical protein
MYQGLLACIINRIAEITGIALIRCPSRAASVFSAIAFSSVSCTPARLNAKLARRSASLGSLFGKWNQEVSSERKSSCGTICCGREQIKKE